jgi:hypothetical protein
MGRGLTTKVVRVALCLMGIGVGGAGCLVLGWNAGELLHAKLSRPEKAAPQALATRFPEVRNQSNNAKPGSLMAGLMQAKQQQIALFAAEASAAPSSSDVSVQLASAKIFGPDIGEMQKPTVAAATHTRSNALLDDSQIASIKKRLNLTASQERMWPAVERELRKLAYAPPQQPQQKGGKPKPPTTYELSGNDLERLKTAAAPLIMSFNDDQRVELRTMARITGLEKFAP